MRPDNGYVASNESYVNTGENLALPLGAPFWNKAALCAFARLGYSLRGDLRVTELVERYRLNAEKCLQLAQNFQELQAKRELLVMANAWLVLAMQREKNIETAAANDSTSPINERPLELR
jgi:hypothetical protein